MSEEEYNEDLEEYHLFNRDDVLPLLKTYCQLLKTNVKIVQTMCESPDLFDEEFIHFLRFAGMSCIGRFVDLANKVAEVTGKKVLSGDAKTLTYNEAMELFKGLVIKDEEDELNDKEDAE